jgi:hypothetical protein
MNPAVQRLDFLSPIFSAGDSGHLFYIYTTRVSARFGLCWRKRRASHPRAVVPLASAPSKIPRNPSAVPVSGDPGLCTYCTSDAEHGKCLSSALSAGLGYAAALETIWRHCQLPASQREGTATCETHYDRNNLWLITIIGFDGHTLFS